MMIQELLGAVVSERKLSNIPPSLLVDSSPTTSSSSSPSQSAASSPSSASTETLRCPRCDSSNTKFCYYNNYNLTQPRHFCKTCRRYWTKGGALRNVPIGGGCRKTKAAATASVIGTKPARPIGRSCSGGGGVHDGHNSCIVDHDVFVPSSPLLWASCSIPHSSHLLALLRATSLQAQQQQQQHHHHHRSPHHNLLNYCVKEEELGDAVGAPMSMMSLDHPMSNINLCNNNNNNNNSSLMQQYQQQSQNLFLADTPTSSGIQELYQRLLAPANCGGNDVNQQHVMIGNNNNGTNNVGHVLGSSAAAMATATAAAAASFVMEPIPLMPGPGEFGYWNPAGLSWADHLSTANGAFP